MSHVKGLGTVALLKAFFDEGADYLGLFYPLVLDVIAQMAESSFDTQAVQRGLVEHHGIDIPKHPLRTLLRRGIRKHHLRREGGRYFRCDIEEEELAPIETIKRRISVEHAELARALVAFAAMVDLEVDSEEEALELIFAFLAENELALRPTGDAVQVAEVLAVEERALRVTAAVIDDVLNSNERLSVFLQRLVSRLVTSAS